MKGSETVLAIGHYLADKGWQALVPVADKHSYFYWPFLTAFMVVGFWLYMRSNETRPLCARGFLRFLFPESHYRHASTVLDAKYFFIQALIFQVLFAIPVALFAGAVTRGVGQILQLSAGEIAGAPLRAPWIHIQGPWITVTRGICFVLALDLGFYIAHRISHAVPLFWEFHKVHHSAERLTPLAGVRFHPVDRLWSALLSFGCAALSDVVFCTLFVTADQDVVLYNQVRLAVFSAPLLYGNFSHSHVWISFGRMSRVLVSPAMHQIHHSRERQHINLNFGQFFSIWDHLLGTAYVPAAREAFAVGIAATEGPEYRGVGDILIKPIAAAIRIHSRRGEPSGPEIQGRA